MNEAQIALLVAIYGALLSTYLAIRESRKERRRLNVVLEYLAFYERPQLIITNTGHRPVTVARLSIAIHHEGSDFVDTVPQNSLYALENEVELPITLSDGETVILALNPEIGKALMADNERVELSVRDAEDNIYKDNKRRIYNAKFGHYESLK